MSSTYVEQADTTWQSLYLKKSRLFILENEVMSQKLTQWKEIFFISTGFVVSCLCLILDKKVKVLKEKYLVFCKTT